MFHIDNELDIWYNYTVDGIHGLSVTKDGETTEYVFRRNFRGDVTHIYKVKQRDALTPVGLTLAARYKYDAWGKCEVEEIDGSGIGAINPIRYRSYYFDTETGLYYLNARYYDPETGRFISADDTKFLNPDAINGLNLFAYCGNNPVMNVDPSGEFFLICFIIGMVAGAVIGAVVGGVAAYQTAKETGATGWELFGWTVFGILGGAVVGGAIGAVAGGTVGGLIAGASAIGGFIGGGGALALAGGGMFAGGAAVGTISVGTAVAIGVGIGVTGSVVLMAKWIPGSWPGDDPTIPPGDGFEWRGKGAPGSNRGAWVNPNTYDSLHPDLHHPAGIKPHWDWVNRVLKIFMRIFK